MTTDKREPNNTDDPQPLVSPTPPTPQMKQGIPRVAVFSALLMLLGGAGWTLGTMVGTACLCVPQETITNASEFINAVVNACVMAVETGWLPDLLIIPIHLFIAIGILKGIVRVRTTAVWTCGVITALLLTLGIWFAQDAFIGNSIAINMIFPGAFGYAFLCGLALAYLHRPAMREFLAED